MMSLWTEQQCSTKSVALRIGEGPMGLYDLWDIFLSTNWWDLFLETTVGGTQGYPSTGTKLLGNERFRPDHEAVSILHENIEKQKS